MKAICFYVLLVFAAVLMSACSGEKKAAELYEIATFEELQTNTSHARQLYEEIIEKYPDTETALKARQALERLPADSEVKGD